MVLLGLRQSFRDSCRRWFPAGNAGSPGDKKGKLFKPFQKDTDTPGTAGTTDAGNAKTNGQTGFPSIMNEEAKETSDVFHSCRGPHCRYFAPVCLYGYCAICCKKHHNYAITGIQGHKIPGLEPVQHGFKVIDRTKDIRESTVIRELKELPALPPAVLVPLEPPACGVLEPTTGMDFPVGDTEGWNKTI